MKYLKPLALFHGLLKTKAKERGRLLGLDVGDKYVGLAISDTHNKIASPLSVLLRKKTNIDLMATDFQSLISELSLVGFVVGYPFERGRAAPDGNFEISNTHIGMSALPQRMLNYWSSRWICIQPKQKPLLTSLLLLGYFRDTWIMLIGSWKEAPE
ncbi:putative pre-16S rRNA nuclease isoform X2 [Manihot esculenta]|uniref:putative pre-16S rRNA nuclease isoform X2 n=1 Tax=Manihot esculenta TaxID=3983 RepID=UPI001CC4B117|nr:putative pre-16S rRNA nuclease isoform X2 [Manihot esculenta]XP_043810051.1 putative pre-16S rRNA nuclease isoform X2 [Manihot esculenta]